LGWRARKVAGDWGRAQFLPIFNTCGTYGKMLVEEGGKCQLEGPLELKGDCLNEVTVRY